MTWKNKDMNCKMMDSDVRVVCWVSSPVLILMVVLFIFSVYSNDVLKSAGFKVGHWFLFGSNSIFPQLFEAKKSLSF